VLFRERFKSRERGPDGRHQFSGRRVLEHEARRPGLERAPRDATLLRAAALCGERAGDLERAAERLRALVGGLPARSEPWFAAKVDQIRVLAALDPARARAVIAQFRALYPELGPTAVRDRILEIERSLPPEQAPAGGAP
jgi:hypothetical protein